MKDEEKDHGAGLIGQTIPDMAGTEPRPNRPIDVDALLNDPLVDDAINVAMSRSGDVDTVDGASWMLSALHDIAIMAARYGAKQVGSGNPATQAKRAHRLHPSSGSVDARVCPQDGKVCWEPGCEVEYCKGVRAGRDGVFEEINAHWFLQGGKSEFGAINEKVTLLNGDGLVAEILARVRSVARPARHIPANDPEWRKQVLAAYSAWAVGYRADQPVSEASGSAQSAAQK